MALLTEEVEEDILACCYDGLSRPLHKRVLIVIGSSWFIIV